MELDEKIGPAAHVAVQAKTVIHPAAGQSLSVEYQKAHTLNEAPKFRVAGGKCCRPSILSPNHRIPGFGQQSSLACNSVYAHTWRPSLRLITQLQ